MAKEKKHEDNSQNSEDTDEVEALLKESPRLLKRLSNLLHEVLTLLKVTGVFIINLWSRMNQCLSPIIGVIVSLGFCYCLDYFMTPLTLRDLPNYPARLQYISRMAALGLFPVICSWFVGLSPLLARLVQSTLSDQLLLSIIHCGLVTFLPIEHMHWIAILMLVTVLARLVHWFSVCHNLSLLQAATEGPLQLCHITVTLYTFLSILAQELGYMQTPTITSQGTWSDSPEWVYPTMCNVMQRLFCPASRPDQVY